MMFNKIFNFNSLLVLALAFVLTACQKENLDELTTQNFTDATKGDHADRKGKKGAKCFQFVYPITYNFPDGATETVADKAEAKAVLKAWKTANPDATGRPTIAFPFDVTLADGTTSNVADEAALTALKETCKDSRDGKGKGKGQSNCFKPNYPLTLNFSDGTSATVADKAEKRAALKAWKTANPDATGRPTIAFPFDVTLADGTTSNVADEAALTAMKETCEGNKGGKGKGGKRPNGKGRPSNNGGN